jgi:hypothetical protein
MRKGMSEGREGSCKAMNAAIRTTVVRIRG